MTTSTRKADENPDEQPQAKSSKPKERSAERGWVDNGDPADEGFYDTPPGAPVNEGFSDIVAEDGK